MKSCDYLTLPECVINEVPVFMSEKERAVYEQFQEDMVAKIKGKEIDAVNAAVLSGKFLQMETGAVYDDEKNSLVIHDCKLNVLEDLIEGANGKPVLIAYWYQHDAQCVKSRFDVREIKDIEDWNAGRIPAAIIHLASAAISISRGRMRTIKRTVPWSI